MSTIASLHRVLPRVLLVEDSETSAAIVSRYLRDQYELVCVPDGVAAWEALSEDTQIQLVVTDVQMPRLNGHELLMKIRAHEQPRIQSLPVIVMTTADNDADRMLAFTNGASDFVGKPLNPLELQARVRVHQRLAQTVRELEASRALLEEQATTDPLTSLKNRRAFNEIGRRHFALAQRHRHDLAVLMLDIDHFKEVNDTYGHPTGDRVLTRIGELLASSVRGGDTAARLGGEEFAVLLPNTSLPGAVLLATRIRQTLESTACSTAPRRIAVTASAGVACYSRDKSESLEQLLEVADRRLYVAKQGGRNRVVFTH